MRQLEKDEVKQTIFEILRAFADYCDENGLMYALYGGTLLGAIRHKDFIPWDDDIDILMPRPDYNKFQELFCTDPIAPEYGLQSFQQGNLGYPFAKIVHTGTWVSNPWKKTDYGLWIDIFPMDGVPDNEEESKKILEKEQRRKYWLTLSHVKIGTGKTRARAIGKIPLVFVAKLGGPMFWTKQMDTYAQRYRFEDSDYAAMVAFSSGAGERMKKEEFISQVEVEFHGSMFHAPSCWDSYLRNIYGDDYMALPPESERRSHETTVYLMEENDRTPWDTKTKTDGENR